MKSTTILASAILMISAVHTLADDSAILIKEFIYYSASFPSCHASTILETPNQGLLAAWFGGTAEANPDVGIWTARFVDGKWTAPAEAVNGIQPDGTRYPCWNPVLFQPKDEPIMLFYKVGPSPEKWWGEVKTSTDAGQTWSEAKRLPADILGPIKNKPVQLADGSILSPTSTETPSKPSAWRVHFEISSDLGKSWTSVSPSDPGDPVVEAIQPSVLFLGGDRLMAVGRSRNAKLFSVTSEDLGKSWGTMKLIDLPNPNSGTDAVTLKDGRHLLVFNNVPKGRSPLNVAISSNGTDWKVVATLEDEPKGEFSYPAIIQASDGRVHITYTWKRKKIRHVVLDPAKL